MSSVALRMLKARSVITAGISQAMQENELPAYIIEPLVADVLSEIRQSAKVELMSEIERETNVNMEQGIHTEKLGEQTVKENPDK